MPRCTSALALALLLAACASGESGNVGADAPGAGDLPARTDAGVDGYVWPDIGPPPDAFVWPVDGAVPPDTVAAPDSGPPPDTGVPCPDPYEPNEVCTAGKSLGSTNEGSVWVSKTATSSPSGDVDWYTAEGLEESDVCFPGTSECFYFKVRLQVPAGRQLKICLLDSSCSATPNCNDNSGNPGPVQLEVQFKVDGTCAFNDDTTAKMWVEQIDAAGACDPYTLSFNFDDC